MKFWLVTFLLAATMFVASKGETFDEFEAINQKKYTNPAERIKRAKIFADNMNRINALNKKAASEKLSVTFGVNKFSDMTPEEFSKAFNGYTPTKLASNETMDTEIKIKSALFTNKAATNVFDWSLKGYMGPVKNQGSTCGSCWAFTAASVVETYYTRLGYSYTSLSEQQLVDCVTGSNCNGGIVYNALVFEKNNGAQKSIDYPYTGKNGRCAHNALKVVVKPRNVYWTNLEKDFAIILNYYGPIGVGVNGNAIQSYKKGILTRSICSSSIVNHAVTLVGYGTENGVSYWRLRNSWGSSWGEAGYYRIQQGNNVCGVISYSAIFVN